MERRDVSGFVFNVQTFSLQDGPGIRTTVFLKGCNLHCYWCHNPESWKMGQEFQFFAGKCIGCGACAQACGHAAVGKRALFTEDCALCGKCAQACYCEAILPVGRALSVGELTELLRRDRDLFLQSGGGVTFSGGEPLLQPEFLLHALKGAKELGISTAMESAVCVPWETLEKMLPWLDLIYCDIKIMDAEKHRQATGADNRRILSNIRRMSGAGANLYLRTPVIPGFNDSAAEIRAIADFAAGLPKTHPVELLAFHGICAGKYTALNREYAARDLMTPSEEQMESLRQIFREKQLPVK